MAESEDGWGRSGDWAGKVVYEKEKLVKFRPGTMLLYRVRASADFHTARISTSTTDTALQA